MAGDRRRLLPLVEALDRHRDRVKAVCAALDALAEPEAEGDPHRGLQTVLRDGVEELGEALEEVAGRDP